MKLAIDASNICVGGGVTHLSHLIDESYEVSKFHSIHMFGGRFIYKQLKDKIRYPVVFHEEPLLNCNIIKRHFWYRYILPKRLQDVKADVLFSLGGFLPSSWPSNVKAVAMNQNILPFMFLEAKKDGLKLLIRRMLQKHLQISSYHRSNGLIFLSEYARNIISKIIPDIFNKSVVIPHGVSKSFRRKPVVKEWIPGKTIELLYVSSIKSYKYQWNVVKAMAILKEDGYNNIKLTFVGPSDPYPLKKLKSAIEAYKMKDHVTLLGVFPYEKITKIYHNASIFVYASICETFGQTLLEAMASGLPIACSNQGPMKEFAGKGVKYFDSKDLASIATAIKYLIDNLDNRRALALQAYKLSKQYTWKNCAKQTFDFLYKSSFC